LEDLSEFLKHFVKIQSNPSSATGSDIKRACTTYEPEEDEDETPKESSQVGACMLYDEENRQARPAEAPDYLEQLPEPHTYMQTGVFRPPLQDYGEWRFKMGAERISLQSTMFALAIGVTRPAPQALSVSTSSGIPAGALKPILSRPRKSTPYLQLLTTPLDADFKTAYLAAGGSADKTSKFLAPLTEHGKADAYFGSSL
jgi:hypothetical protein